jgi:uncharacterized protein YndB with AHSA1/START domain
MPMTFPALALLSAIVVPLLDIVKRVEVPADRAAVWAAWTTDNGARTFFAARSHIDATLGGPYELYFLESEPYGGRGGEGARVHSLVPQEEIMFTWTAPPTVPAIRTPGLLTLVSVWLRAIDDRHTEVVLTQTAWGRGAEWAKVHDYFQSAWDVVLGRLRYRFTVGPVDWASPPVIQESFDAAPSERGAR